MFMMLMMMMTKQTMIRPPHISRLVNRNRFRFVELTIRISSPGRRRIWP